MKSKFLSLCLLLLAIPSYSFASEAWPPGRNVGDAIGVQIKAPISREELENIKSVGFKYVRVELNWPSIETTAGVYDWSNADKVIADIRSLGFHAVLLLNGNNTLYAQKAPSSPAAVQAFARFASNAVSRYDGNDIVWEIWNEPDSKRFWPPKPDVNAFSVLADMTCKAVRKISPRAVLIGPALAQVPDASDGVTSDYLNKFLKSPASKCLDAFSLHPYRHGDEVPEAAQVDYEVVRAAMLNADHKNRRLMPIVNSEWGYSTSQASEERQAEYIVRSYIINLMNGVPLSIWYEWKDSRGAEPDDPEGHFGIVTADGDEKPAVESLRNHLSVLKDFRITRRMQVADNFDYVFLLQNDKENKRAVIAWTIRPGEGKTANMVIMDDGDSSVYPLSGQPVIVPLSDANAQIMIMGNGGEY